MSDAAPPPADALSESDAELLARRREIAETGIAIADEQGIDAVSMRNIATRLGIGTMTLYTWVENKDDLIGVMADALSDQMLVPEPMPEDWREALTEIAIATRNVFTAHPWMLGGGRPPARIGANMLRHVDQSLRAVQGLDLDWPLRASILQAVDHYALGYAVANQRREQRVEALREHDGTDYGAAFEKISEARAHKARTEAVVSRGDAANAIELRAMFESGSAPALIEIFGSPEEALERIKGGPPKIEGDFDDGLRWMLDGIAAMLESRGARQPRRVPDGHFTSFPAIVDRLASDPPGPALIELARDGSRREYSFDDVVDGAARYGGAFAAQGVGVGDVVITLIGNRPQWVFAMLGCWRMGAVVLPCNEMLRAKDLALRIASAAPKLVVTDERNRAELEASGWDGPTIVIPDDSLLGHEPTPLFDAGPSDPAMMIFTSGTTGEPKPVVHTHGCLPGQDLQAVNWFDAKPGEIAWCTAASGWSKSARNVFLTPWLCGAAAVLHDVRFDPAERMATIAAENVNVLCMAPTEYRVIARRLELERIDSLRRCVSAGEALNAEIFKNWHDGLGVDIHDGYGQTETGAITAVRPGDAIKPGSMGRPMPGIEIQIEDGELWVDPTTVPTFFAGYGRPGELDPPELHADADGRSWWRTGDLVNQDEDGYLWFDSRNDDIISSAGYRIGPFEVESALISHPAVAEAAAVALPDPERGSVVRAVLVLKDGYEAGDALATELQEHVKNVTAPYKYPRVIEFADSLPKTASGKIRRAELRRLGPS